MFNPSARRAIAAVGAAAALVLPARAQEGGLPPKNLPEQQRDSADPLADLDAELTKICKAHAAGELKPGTQILTRLDSLELSILKTRPDGFTILVIPKSGAVKAHLLIQLHKGSHHPEKVRWYETKSGTDYFQNERILGPNLTPREGLHWAILGLDPTRRPHHLGVLRPNDIRDAVRALLPEAVVRALSK